jgi:type II secretory pathway pseudopilin PulG
MVTGKPSEAGYNMVILAVAITVLAVLTAAALPVWSHLLKREKEEELIFRGWQYAEAIRVFQQRQNRPPTRLQELIEIEPRSIRQLWEDPMTENGQWDLIPVGGGRGPNPNDPNAPRLPQGGGLPGQPGEANRGGTDEEQSGPFTGVKSRSTEDSIKTLFGSQNYAEWEFTVEALVSGQVGSPASDPSQPQTGPDGRPVPTRPPQPGEGAGQVGIGRPPSLPVARWIGRPFPDGVQPEMGAAPGGLPGQQPGGGLPGGQNTGQVPRPIDPPQGQGNQ